MRRLVGLSALAVLCFFQLAGHAADDHAAPKRREVPDYLSNEEAQTAELYRRVLPTVVTVLTSGLPS